MPSTLSVEQEPVYDAYIRTDKASSTLRTGSSGLLQDARCQEREILNASDSCPKDLFHKRICAPARRIGHPWHCDNRAPQQSCSRCGLGHPVAATRVNAERRSLSSSEILWSRPATFEGGSPCPRPQPYRLGSKPKVRVVDAFPDSRRTTVSTSHDFAAFWGQSEISGNEQGSTTGAALLPNGMAHETRPVFGPVIVL